MSRPVKNQICQEYLTADKNGKIDITCQPLKVNHILQLLLNKAVANIEEDKLSELEPVSFFSKSPVWKKIVLLLSFDDTVCQPQAMCLWHPSFQEVLWSDCFRTPVEMNEIFRTSPRSDIT